MINPQGDRYDLFKWPCLSSGISVVLWPLHWQIYLNQHHCHSQYGIFSQVPEFLALSVPVISVDFPLTFSVVVLRQFILIFPVRTPHVWDMLMRMMASWPESTLNRLLLLMLPPFSSYQTTLSGNIIELASIIRIFIVFFTQRFWIMSLLLLSLSSSFLSLLLRWSFMLYRMF